MATYDFRAGDEDVMQARSNRAPRGSYLASRASDKTNKLWPNYAAFELWRTREEETHGFQFIHRTTERDGVHYDRRETYVCNRSRSGGGSNYLRKTSKRVKGSSKLEEGCTCILYIRTYRDIPQVTGEYNREHAHGLGNENLQHLRISNTAREGVKSMARQGVSRERAFQMVRSGEFNISPTLQRTRLREEVVSSRFINYHYGVVETETVRLDRDDGRSSSLWAERLRKEEALLFMKTCDQEPPPGSNLDSRVLLMIIQTSWQRQRWNDVGHHYMGIDATHNTTHYVGVLLFTIMARDRWGRGLPVCWMIASNGQTETIRFFLDTFRNFNPVLPRQILTDRDEAQINALKSVYPTSSIYLCLWHVLHSWRQHLRTEHHPLVWKRLQELTRINQAGEFFHAWAWIKQEAPGDFTTYFEKYWYPDEWLVLWSAMFRRDRSLLEQQDTTNLVESWHHFLKGSLLKTKRNRRLDVLITRLVRDGITHFQHRHDRQELGFEGKDLVMQRVESMEVDGGNIPLSLVTLSSPENDTDTKVLFTVQSQKHHDIIYNVDWVDASCDCKSFRNEQVGWCKHLTAVKHFIASSKEESIQTVELPHIPPLPASPSVISSPVPTLRSTRSQSSLADNDLCTPSSASTEELPETVTSEKEEWWGAIQAQLRMSGLDKRQPDFTKFGVEELKSLHDMLWKLQNESSPSTLRGLPPAKLPPIVKLPPNIKTSTETAASMPPLKRKRPSQHADPYSAGEGAGKKVKGKHLAPLPLPNVTFPSINGVTSGHPATMLSVDSVFHQDPPLPSHQPPSHQPYGPQTSHLSSSFQESSNSLELEFGAPAAIHRYPSDSIDPSNTSKFMADPPIVLSHSILYDESAAPLQTRNHYA